MADRAVENDRVENEKHSDEDSDDGQFITIKVTANPSYAHDDELERTDCSEMEEARTPTTQKVHHRVTLVESPTQFGDDHVESHEKDVSEENENEKCVKFNA